MFTIYVTRSILTVASRLGGKWSTNYSTKFLDGRRRLKNILAYNEPPRSGQLNLAIASWVSAMSISKKTRQQTGTSHDARIHGFTV